MSITIPKDFTFLGDPPYKHQITAFQFGIQNHYRGLLLDLGLGKTKTSIDIARYRIQYSGVKRVLVVAPTGMLYRWQEEIKRFSEYTSVILHGTRSERLDRIKRKNKYTFFIINYEALKLFKKQLLSLKFDMIILDESSRYLKTPTSGRTEAAVAIADRARYKVLLTATLIPNSPLNVWPQFRVLDGGITFFNNYYRFKNYFFKTIEIGGWKKWILRKDRIKEFNSRIYSRCIKITKKEAVTLPREVYATISVDLSTSEMQAYKDLKEKILAELITKDGSGVVDVTNTLTKLIRLQQYTAGFIKTIQGKEKELKAPPKLLAIIDEIGTIVEANESVIVWCRFRKSIKMIKAALDKLKIPVITMSGEDTNAKKKYQKWREYQTNKDIHVFIGQIEAGGIGIELFKEDGDPKKFQHSITYEGVWNPDAHVQAGGRSHRQGQKSMVRHLTIVVKDTIDEYMHKARRSKQDIADLLMKQGVRKILE